MDTSIQRLYYSITEVSKIIGEEQHVLRYWEREFPQLKPVKNRAGNRVYTKKDLEVLGAIKKLLRDERYTVAGAKEHLGTYGTSLVGDSFEESRSAAKSTITVDSVSASRVDLTEVRRILGDLRDISQGLRSKIAMAS
jgi:DNA-binding transcriptional MerR regulator